MDSWIFIPHISIIFHSKGHMDTTNTALVNKHEACFLACE